MGSACCVAAKDRTVTNGPSSEILQRNVRYSPSWSFRWDNRGRVAGEEISMNLFSHGVNRNVGLDIKSLTPTETAYASEEGSPLDSFRTHTWQKSPTSEGNGGILRLPPLGKPILTVIWNLYSCVIMQLLEVYLPLPFFCNLFDGSLLFVIDVVDNMPFPPAHLV